MMILTMKPMYLLCSPLIKGINMAGQIHTLLYPSTDELVSFFDRVDTDNTSHKLFISRLPQRRLVERLDITDIECYWLTDKLADGAIEPSYQKMLSLISSRLSNHKGSIFIEGSEWLVSLHGFDALLGFIRTLSDSLHRTYWNVYLSIEQDSFTPTEFNHIIREAPIYQMSDNELTYGVEEGPMEPMQRIISEHIDVDLHEDGSPKLVFLTRLPESGFTKSLLQRRVLQWRRMGLDVSEIESALYSTNKESMYQSYTIIEEKVRRAVQLDNWISENVTDSQERSIAQFRVRQLTGLDELEQRYFPD